MMCNHVIFTAWLYLAEDQHPGALRAMADGIPVDPDELEAAIINQTQESETKPTATKPQPTDPIQN